MLFDGSWLWEEYINLLISDNFYHPMNKENKGAQRLFDHNRGVVYPDFIGKNAEARHIADAKYKPVDNISNKDYLQILAYMLRFDAQKGFFFYPDTSAAEDTVMKLNSGSTYEKNVMPRDDISVIKHGFHIPEAGDDYQLFVKKMRISEERFISGINDNIK